MFFKSIIGTTYAFLACISFSVDAALESRLGGLAYYDDVADLTWLADANYAKTSSYDDDGLMTFLEAKTWVADLDVAGVTGWYLPDTIQPDLSCETQDSGISYGYNCTGSDMGNLYYNVLGNTGSLSNTGPFVNVQDGVTPYWSATELYPLIPNGVWVFSMSSGDTGYGYNYNYNYAWAVHAGDVSAVPVPAAAWLFGSGLIGLMSIARRKRT